MLTKQITLEQLLYSLAFVLALGIRLLNLGEAPLSDFEAGWALQSWHAAQGGSLNLGPNPGYISLTTTLFFLLGSSNALARFWPALVGSLLALAPLGFRRLLGREAALVLAFGLALDPGMAALSRLAGGPMLAIGFGALALVFIYARQLVLGGIFGGLALISGPAVLTGALGFGIAWGVGRLAGITPGWGNFQEAESPQTPVRSHQDALRSGLIFGAATILLVSTLFFYSPKGIGAWADTLPEYLRGWTSPSGIPALRPLLAVAFYQPLALIFGVLAAVRAWAGDDKLARWLSLWFVSALLLAMACPGRQVFDVAWALLPLWGLAALELARYLRVPQPGTVALGQATVVLVLLVLIWLVSLKLATGGLAWLIYIIVPVLIVLTTILVALGWSWDAARSGLVWGLNVALGLYVVAALFGVSQVRPNSSQELWTPPPATVQAGLLEKTLNELALMQNGRGDWLDAISLVDQPSLQWVLRDFSGVRTLPSLDAKASPTVIITSEDDVNLLQTSAYRGQDFLWSQYPGWEGALPSPWFRWVTWRQAPLRGESVVVWARVDLFPDESSSVQDGADLPPEDGNVE